MSSRANISAHSLRRVIQENFAEIRDIQRAIGRPKEVDEWTRDPQMDSAFELMRTELIKTRDSLRSVHKFADNVAKHARESHLKLETTR